MNIFTIYKIANSSDHIVRDLFFYSPHVLVTAPSL